MRGVLRAEGGRGIGAGAVRTALANYRVKPSGWHSQPCAAYGCRKASSGGGLCAVHRGKVAGDVAADLKAAGLDSPEPLRVARTPSDYLTVLIGGRWIQVHRVVMEATLDRPLLPGENVHHINGVKWDNSPSNLELWVTAQPSGQRPSDLADYARRLLARYGNDAERARYGEATW